VIVDGLGLLILVPDRDDVGTNAHVALVRQFVPAGNGRDDGRPHGLRRANEIHLIGRGVDQR